VPPLVVTAASSATADQSFNRRFLRLAQMPILGSVLPKSGSDLSHLRFNSGSDLRLLRSFVRLRS
jgi:hypothetical protein